ncbi:MAG: MarR family winged helix-turn-helix transcriptional regulator [Muribaculaceae bacterium]|nr:MarR family winged helix-turn-helix transcriptional regulator [Muribaculaceae bacterium]
MNEEKLNGFEDDLFYQIDYTANFNKSFRREFAAKYINSDISSDECTILFHLKYCPDISQSELARGLFKGKAHVGKILNDMENKGLIKRVADTRDNTIIKKNQITEKGLQTLKKGEEVIELIIKKMDSEFSAEEIKTFLKFLKRYRSTLNSIVDVRLK